MGLYRSTSSVVRKTRIVGVVVQHRAKVGVVEQRDMSMVSVRDCDPGLSKRTDCEREPVEKGTTTNFSLEHQTIGRKFIVRQQPGMGKM